MALLALSFLGGILTILSPCVLPLLPVIIGGSLTGQSKWRPVIIAASLSVSLVAFTLLLKFSTALIDVSPNTWTSISGGIVIALGFVTVFPHLWEVLSMKLNLQGRSNALLAESSQKHNWFGSVLIGLSLGPVFSSCSPTYALILATVLPLTFFAGLLNLFAYALGLASVLLVIAVFGQSVVKRIKWAADPTGWFKRGLGVLFILVGLLIITGFMKDIETYLVERGFGITRLEQQLVEGAQTDMDTALNTATSASSDINTNPLFNVKNPVPAPELIGLTNWINSEPLSMESLRGKVVLIDFWTYSCINCIRTLPYIQAWNEKYGDDGLVIIGVHAPEFAFEQVPANVEAAVKEHGLTYPIALDNDFSTWRAYGNKYWPAKYFIDREGKLRHYHFGEGEYAESEEVIRALLAEGGSMPSDEIDTSKETAVQIPASLTPETYLGFDRADQVQSTPTLRNGLVTEYMYPAELMRDHWAYSGNWLVDGERAISKSATSSLKLHFSAKEVYLVMGSDTPAQVEVRLNNENIPAGLSGESVLDSKVMVKEYTLYRLVNLPTFTENQELELIFPEGVQVNAFTFGG